jgi:hypothetical protein
LDVDLSTVQFAADKVFRLLPPAEGLLHLEPQASWDGELADRMHVYNTLLEHRYKVPVYSVALLLRREANSPRLDGTLTKLHADGKEYLRFVYDVVRVWELPCEPLMAGGPGAVPLALLTDEATGRLPELVARMDRQMREAGEPEGRRKLILASSFILLGLRYNDDAIRDAFLGVQGMQESTTFQWIMEQGRKEGHQAGRQEGRQEGRLEGRQEGQQVGLNEGLVLARKDTLLAILRDRFPGSANPWKSAIDACSDPARLHDAILKAIHIGRIEDLDFPPRS